MTLEEFYQIPNITELYNFMRKNIHYGFLCSLDGQIHTRQNTPDSNLYETLLFNHYYLQTPEELLQSGYGLCFDQVELIRAWFWHHQMLPYAFYTPFHNHSFLAFQNEKEYGLIETTLKRLNGIYLGNSLEEVLDYYSKLQLNGQKRDMDLYLYESITFGSNFQQYKEEVKKEENKILKLTKK